MKEKGRFITFEGPEGCGKTTQVQLLTAFLGRQGIVTVSPREPGGTPAGEAIRNVLQHDNVGEDLSPEAEALLFGASRAILVRDLIIPALEMGKWVVCDRFSDSTVAYQGYGRECDVEKMILLNSFATRSVTPDLTILLDIEIDKGFKRIETRNGLDRMERASRDFHQRVRKGYLELADRFRDRFMVLDGSLPVDEVEKNIQSIVRERFGLL